MARITLPGFSRGIYAVGPLIFEDGVAEYDGELPLVVERLAYALGASIDGTEPPAVDPVFDAQPDEPVDAEPTPAEVWGVGEKATRTNDPADSSVEAAPVIDFSAPTGGRADLEAPVVEEPTVDAGDGTPVPGSSEAGDVDPGATSDESTADAGTPGPATSDDAAPSEPQPTEADGTPIPAPADPTPEEQAAAEASTSTPADSTPVVDEPAPADEVPSTVDTASGKHAADVDDAAPVTSDAAPAADDSTAPASGA